MSDHLQIYENMSTEAEEEYYRALDIYRNFSEQDYLEDQARKEFLEDLKDFPYHAENH